MRTLTSIALVTTTILVGCRSPSVVQKTGLPGVAEVRPFRSMLITTFGTNTSPDGTWRIGVSETSLALTRLTATQSDGQGLTISNRDTTSPEAWKAKSGWFVFVETKSRVWAYDGDRLLTLNTYTSNGNNSKGATYSNSGFPCAVPAEVFSRLSEPAQEALKPIMSSRRLVPL